MFRHNLLIALRNLKRHKGSFIINLLGLSTGLACTFLIYLWVTDELQFDKFHKNDTRLFQVMEKSTENGNVIIHEETQGPLAQAMEKDLPEVISAVPVMSLDKNGMKIPLRSKDKIVKSSGVFAGKDFFDLFSFKLLSGNAKQVLNNEQAIVLSEKLAVSLFGSAENAVNKNVGWEILGKRQTSMVSGVFADPPSNNSMNFEFAIPWDLLYNQLFPSFQKWWNEGADTYLLMTDGTDMAQFNKKIEHFITRYHSDSTFTLFTRQYSSAYLQGSYENGVQTGGRIEYVKLFSIIAVFILIIASINFMNLSTAKSSRRLKEVGIKKAIGSTKKALVIQFLSEAVFMAFFSLAVAVIIVMIVLPYFNTITGKNLEISLNPKLISLALLTTFVTGILAGSYPAFYMSGFDVVSVFRGKLKKSFGELLARKGLVVFQFSISLVLIFAVLVIVKQVNYVQSKQLGFDKSNIIYFDREGSITQNIESFISDLKKVPGVVNASSVQENVIQNGLGSSTYGITWPGKTEKQLVDFAVRAVNFDFIETLGMKIAQGRSFSRDYGAEKNGIIFNETAVKLMGLKHPVGTKITMWQEEMSIIGVLKDFHITSLHEAIAPVVIKYDPERTSTIMARIEPGKEKETISKIEELYKRFNPGYILQYKFLDEVYQAQYVSEQRIAVLARYFAGLAIIISCLGLFGLSAFNAEVRTKEIGIRKVLGASVANVILLLSKDFMVLIIISMLIAFPLAWWSMNHWLNTFAFRVNIGAGVFVVAGLSVVILTLITVSYQSVRAALMNPVMSLRTE
ncbi:MAG TPA: ABC transporter permease [Flavitalea sp.]|nr:ABC transporter permease [Flavitalea sp.]